MRSKQKFIRAKYFDEKQTEPMRLDVTAYGRQFTPSLNVVHGTVFTCPEPAINNVTIFKIADYPKPKPKRKQRSAKKQSVVESEGV